MFDNDIFIIRKNNRCLLSFVPETRDNLLALYFISTDCYNIIMHLHKCLYCLLCISYRISCAGREHRGKRLKFKLPTLHLRMLSFIIAF